LVLKHETGKDNKYESNQDCSLCGISVTDSRLCHGQTASSLINVSSPSDDTVRLAGFVSNDGIRQEAERLAYQVEGVRFVVNTLELQ